MKSEILKTLYASGDYISGQDMCDSLGVSRTAVWKVMQQLKEEGYIIESAPRKGYRIVKSPDVIFGEEIEARLYQRKMGNKVFYYPQIDSTNTMLKKLAIDGAKEGTLVVTDEQMQGKGRRGRVWEMKSKEAIAMSLLLRPKISPMNASMLTLIMGISVAQGLLKLYPSLDVQLKWPNDILIGKKKVAGILTEMSMESDYINYLVVGIGINANILDFPPDLLEKATSLKKELGHAVQRSPIIAVCMEQFEENYKTFLATEDLSRLQETYNQLLVHKDKQVYVIQPKETYQALALGINHRGELLVSREDGQEETVSSGEISIRGLTGYV